MQNFTIRDIENLTGIKAHTLRIWEQRYRFLTPKRKESLHRFYDNEDLKNMLRISFLYHRGWKVSKIAALTPEEIVLKVQETAPGPPGAGHWVTQLIEAALDFNEPAFVAVLQEATAAMGFEQCILQVAYPYLHKLGLLWSTSNIIPAQEHFSSYIIQNRIIAEMEKIDAGAAAPEIILLCPQGEYHELPLLFINYLLRSHGWATLYLGTNVRKNELEQLSGLPSLRYVYLHLITNFTGLFVDEYLEEVCRIFPG